MSGELATIQNELAEIQNLPAILETNQGSKSRAAAASESLLAEIATKGMSDDYDDQCNTMLVRLKQTVDKLKENRMPVTKLFDQVKTQFTTLENEVTNYSGRIKAERDSWATKKAEEARKLAEEARKKQARENEIIEYRAKCEECIRYLYTDFQTRSCHDLISDFNKATLSDFDQTMESIRMNPASFTESDWRGFIAPSFHNLYMQDADMEQLWILFHSSEKYKEFQLEFNRAINELKQELLDKAPAKKAELEAIDKAKGTEAKRLLKEKEEREAREKKEREAAETARLEQEKVDLEAKKEGEKLNVAMNTELDLFSATSNAKTEPDALEILIKNPAAIPLIVSFYFKYQEKAKITVESFEKLTGKQMIAFAEKEGKKGTIIDSPYIEYKEVYKTRVNSK